MADRAELTRLIFRLQNEKRKEQLRTAAEILEVFYSDDATLRLIAEVLRPGQGPTAELNSNDQNMAIHYELLVSDGLTHEEALRVAGNQFNKSESSVANAVTKARKAGLIVRS